MTEHIWCPYVLLTYNRCPLLNFKQLFYIHGMEAISINHCMYGNKNHYSVMLFLYFYSLLPHPHILRAHKKLLGIW